MEILLSLLILLVLVFLARKLLQRIPAATKSADFQAQAAVLSRAEMNFFRVLDLAKPDGLMLLASVRLANVLKPVANRRTDRKRHSRQFNQISQKQLDFLLCDARTSRPVLAIELQDGSHNSEKRRQRDAFLSDALHQAGIPLLLVRAARSYSIEEIRQQISESLPEEASIAGFSALD